VTNLAGGLSASIRGAVIGPDDSRYDYARRSFNAMVDARPALIARPVDDADIAAAVQFARKEGLPIAVRGGGHSVAGHCVGEGSLVIDLRLRRDVVVDAARRSVTVGGGACWNDVDAPTQAEQLAMPGGTFGDTGIAGLALTGGIGHLIGAHGLTLDNLTGARVITADGRVVLVDAEGEPDLFWALRGGGGNFGIVSEFQFALHPVYAMTGGVLLHRLTDAAEALRVFRDMRSTMPDRLTLMPTLTGLDSFGGHGMGLLTAVAYIGPPDGAQDLLSDLRAVGPPLFDNVGYLRYHQVQGLYGYTPFGLRHYWTSRFVEDLPDDLIDFLVAAASEEMPGTDAELQILFEPVHGAASRVPEDSTAFPFRSAQFNISGLSIWDDPALDEEMIDRARVVRERLSPLSRGGYLNYSMDDARDSVATTFGAARWARLRAVKAKWDPDNVFRFNHNIPPA
jgi:FAD/FMN-containing dehydrogenase